jgi:hypothetical protein
VTAGGTNTPSRAGRQCLSGTVQRQHNPSLRRLSRCPTARVGNAVQVQQVWKAGCFCLHVPALDIWIEESGLGSERIQGFISRS